MNDNICISAGEALERLRRGNESYVSTGVNKGDISPRVRASTCNGGQHPYAIIIACSDSRVIPEVIFGAGIGELFVIRVAGNVMDSHQLGSVEYAAEHLGSKLVVVLGHNHCGAVDAALNHEPSGYIKYITDSVREAIGDEKDEYTACRLNVENSVRIIEENIDIQSMEHDSGLRVIGAMYDIETGRVDFLSDI